MTGSGVPRPVDPKTVALPWRDGGQVAVPHVAVDLVEGDAFLGAVLGDQAQLDLLGHLGEQREVGARTVVRGAERIRGTGPYGRDHLTTSRLQRRSDVQARWSWSACRWWRCGESRGTASHFPPRRGSSP